MAYQFKLEDPGEGIHEAEILEVLVSEGDTVKEGDNVLVAETDKAAVEIPTPVSGSVREIRVSEGDIVEVGTVLMVFDEASAEGAGEAEDQEQEEEEEKEEQEREEQEKDAGKKTGAETEEEAGGEEEGEAEEEAEAKETTEGREAKAAPSGEARKDKAEEARGGRRGGPVPASPAARRVARELGIDLREVQGSGEEGRVYEEDVRAAADTGGRRRGGAKRPRLPDFERWGPTERLPLRSIRRAIANRMAQSWAEIPHVTHQDEIDITELERLRRAHQREVEEGGGALTLTPFFVKALVAALKQHPRFNASFDPDAEEIVLKHYYNIGVALDTERGLLVPVIRDADQKSVVELAVELKEMAGEIRGGTAPRERVRGGTFSLTNVGSLGGTQFSPLINYPEAAIFGTARAQLRPVALGDLDDHLDDHRIEVRLMLPVCIAFDHRINDGADAARFMETVREVLSDPEEMVLMG